MELKTKALSACCHASFHIVKIFYKKKKKHTLNSIPMVNKKQLAFVNLNLLKKRIIETRVASGYGDILKRIITMCYFNLLLPRSNKAFLSASMYSAS